MTIHKSYSIYEFNNILGNENHKALCLLYLDYYDKEEYYREVHNSFNTEEEAIEALVTCDKTYGKYVILRTIYIN